MQFLPISRQKLCTWDDDFYRKAVHVMFTETSAKKLIKQYNDRAVADIIKEYK